MEKKVQSVFMLITLFILFYILALSVSNTSVNATERARVNIWESNEKMMRGTPIINRTLLEQLYHKRGTITIDAKHYRIILKGTDIVNYNNPLHTNIDLESGQTGAEFNVNNGNYLPGSIEIEFSKDALPNQKYYTYIYDSKAQKYRLVDIHLKNRKIKIDTPGQYYITNDKMRECNVKPAVIIMILVAIFILMIAYVLLVKKYWFW